MCLVFQRSGNGLVAVVGVVSTGLPSHSVDEDSDLIKLTLMCIKAVDSSTGEMQGFSLGKGTCPLTYLIKHELT